MFRRGPAGIIAALWLAEITGSFETAMIFAALNRLIADFNDPVLVGWLITTFLLIGAGSAAIAGRLGDLYGRRRVMLILLAVGVVGSLISAFSTSFAVLLFGRALQGITGAILPLALGLVRENMTRERVPMAIGLMISGASAGTAAGLVIGGMIVDQFSWHGVFFASAGFAATAFVAILAGLPPSPKAHRDGPLDWLGGVLFVPGILGLLLVISSGPKWGWLDLRTIGIAIASIAVLVVWVRHSLASREPLFDVRLFRNRQILVANLATALIATGALQITLVFSVLLQAPRWTMIGLGATATVAGLAKLPSNIGSLFAGPLSGWLTERHGGRIVMLIGGGLTTLGWLLAMAFNDSILVVTIILCVISFGTTMLFAVGPTILVDAVAPDRTSEAAGMMTVVRQAFMGIGAQIIAILLATETVAVSGSTTRYPTPAAFMLAMSVIIGLASVATLLAFALPKRARPKTQWLEATAAAFGWRRRGGSTGR